MQKCYLAGPMRGYPEFNFPAFHRAARELRDIGFEVFSPAEKDIERHGYDISQDNPNGSVEDAVENHGFSLRDALHDDLAWICKHATHIALLPGWERSDGARAEHATATALKLQFIYLT